MGTSLQMEGMVTVTCDCAGDQNRRGARTELFRRRLCTFQWHLKMGPKWRAWRCHRCARGWCLELIGRAARLSGEGGVGKGRRPSLFKRWMRLSKVSVCARVHESLCMCMRVQLLKNESVSPCVKVYFRHEQHSNLRNTQATTKMARQTMFSAAGACLSLCATAHTHYAYRLNILNPLIKCVFMVCMHACVCVCTWESSKRGSEGGSESGMQSASSVLYLHGRSNKLRSGSHRQREREREGVFSSQD